MAISAKLNRIPAKLTIIGRVKESFLLWSAMSCTSIQMVDALRLSISSA